MAIKWIGAPSEVPASVDDYAAQNNLLQALLLSVQGAQRIVGSNVAKGAVFLVGGATYLADANTAISGSASDYVKLTPSVDGLTLAPSYVANLSGVAWNSTYNGYYDTSGNLYVFDEVAAVRNGSITSPKIEFEKHGQRTYLVSGNFIVPPRVYEIFLTGCGCGGSGGAGGSGNFNGSTRIGGGGGGGGGSAAYCFKQKVVVVPGDIISITIPTVAGSPVIFGSSQIQSGGNGGNGGNASTSAVGTAGAGGAAGVATSGLSRAGSSGSVGNDGTSTSGTGQTGGNGGSGNGNTFLGLLGTYGAGGVVNSVGSSGLASFGYGCGGGGGGGGGGCTDYVIRAGGAGGAGGPAILVVEW